MRLIQCVASKGGLFRNKHIDFAGKVTVLYGPNDSGKTFLARALIDLETAAIPGDSSQSLIRWDTTHLDLTFEHEAARFTISRTADEKVSLSETSGSNSILLFSETPGTAVRLDPAMTAFPAFKRYVSMMSRLGAKGCMETGFIASPLDSGGSLDYAILRRLFLEDESGFCRLHGMMTDLFSGKEGAGCGAGILEQIAVREQEIRQIEKKIQLAAIQDERRIKMAQERRDISGEIESLQGRRTVLETKLTDAGEITRLQKEIEAAEGAISDSEHNRCLEQDKIRAVSSVRETLAKVFPQFAAFTEIHKENLSLIQGAYRKIRESNEKLGRLLDRRAAMKRGQIIRTAAVFLVSAAAAAAVYVLPFVRKHHLLFPSLLACCAAAAVLCAALFICYHFRISRLPVDAAIEDKHRNETRLKEILIENGLQLENIGTDEIYEFLLQYFEEYGFFSEQESDILSMEATLKDNVFFTQMKKQLGELRAEKEKLETQIDGILPKLSCGEKRTSLEEIPSFIAATESEIKSIAKETAEKEIILSRLDEELSAETVPTQNEEGLSDRMSQLKGELVVLCRKNRTAHYILGLMDESIVRREDILARRLASVTASIFHRLTGNQYITAINEQSILSFMKGETTPSFNTQLSHMLVLSTKLALSDRLKEEHIDIPLFIDEPAVYMDSARIKNFIEIIREFSDRRQIVILSHDRTLCDSADAVIEL